MLVLLVCAGEIAARADDTLLFADRFDAKSISDAWEIHTGNWSIDDAALVNQDGGLITLKMPPGGRFSLEFEIAFPSNWMSVIPFLTKPDDYATLYMTNGYWESFEMKGEQLVDYIQHRDPGIVTSNGFHTIKLVADFGVVSLFFDGEEKGTSVFPFRPGSRIGFKSLPKAGLLKIRNLRVTELEPVEEHIVFNVSRDEFSRALIYKDRGTKSQPATEDRLSVDAVLDTGVLKYQFNADDEFESNFVRLPVQSPNATRLFMQVDGDGSENNFFVIVHDASGEQHLVMKTLLAWEGPQEVGINLVSFLESPPKMERHLIHWGGDENQRIDFPLTAIDVGIAKQGSRIKNAGGLGLTKIRLTK